MKLINNCICKLNNIIDEFGYKYIIVCCMLISLIISFYYSGMSLWFDELFSAMRTRSDINIISVIKEASLLDTWPPLYYIILHYIQILFGNSELSLRSISIISNMLCIPTIYLLAKETYSKKEALLSCILLSFSPLALSLSVEVRGYSLFLLLSIISLYFLHKSITCHKNIYLLYGYFFVAFLCTLTHYFGLLFVIFQLIFLCMNNKKFIKQHYIYFIFFILAIFIYPFIHYNMLCFKADIFKHNALFGSHIVNRNFFILDQLIPNLLFNIYIIIETTLLYICFFYFFINLKKQNNQFILFFVVLPLFVVNLFAYKFMSFLQVRYFIFMLPLIYIIISHFLFKVSQKYYYIIALSIFIFLSCHVNEIQIENSNRSDRDNILFIKYNLAEKNNVFFHYNYYYIEYYLKKFDIKNDMEKFANLSDCKKEIEELLNIGKKCYVLFQFGEINDYSSQFKFVKVYDKIYEISKSSI